MFKKVLLVTVLLSATAAFAQENPIDTKVCEAAFQSYDAFLDEVYNISITLSQIRLQQEALKTEVNNFNGQGLSTPFGLYLFPETKKKLETLEKHSNEAELAKNSLAIRSRCLALQTKRATMTRRIYEDSLIVMPRKVADLRYKQTLRRLERNRDQQKLSEAAAVQAPH